MQQKKNITGEDNALAIIVQAEANLLKGAPTLEAAEKLLVAFNKINEAVLNFKKQRIAEINK